MGCATVVVVVRATLMLTGWVPDNELGAQGAAALAGALGQLMNLTRLNLECSWNVDGLYHVVLLAVQAARLCD